MYNICIIYIYFFNRIKYLTCKVLPWDYKILTNFHRLFFFLSPRYRWLEFELRNYIYLFTELELKRKFNFLRKFLKGYINWENWDYQIRPPTGIVVGPSIFGMQEYWVPGCIKIPHHSAGHTPQLCATIGTLFYVHNCRLSHYRLTMCWNSTLIPNSDLSSRRMQT